MIDKLYLMWVSHIFIEKIKKLQVISVFVIAKFYLTVETTTCGMQILTALPDHSLAKSKI